MSIPHIVVAHLADGPKTTDHPSKAAALRACAAHRSAGAEAYVYGAAFARKYGLDPRERKQEEGRP